MGSVYLGDVVVVRTVSSGCLPDRKVAPRDLLLIWESGAGVAGFGKTSRIMGRSLASTHWISPFSGSKQTVEIVV